MTPARPLLTAWQMLSDANRRELFSSIDHMKAAELFAEHADPYQDAAGNFNFPAAKDMSLTLSTAAVQAALKYHTETAKALAKLVTLPVGSRKHQGAITTLMQLVYHLSPRVKAD
jgi:hypothetical protein